MAGPVRVTAKFVKERETRNTVRYSEVSTFFIGKLYIQKETFNGGPIPAQIEISISYIT